MNLLTFTSLWPNAEQPNLGVFIKHRVAAMSHLDGVNLRVVAPVPYFPKRIANLLSAAAPNAIPRHWVQMARLPEFEEVGGLPTFHPRSLVTPKLGMRFYGNWMARGAWETVWRLHAENPFDVIDAHYVYPDGYAAVQLGRRLNIPVILSARGSDISQFSHLPYIQPMIINALNRASGVIAVSEALKQRMVELGIIPAKIAVIPNGIDRDTFNPRNRNAARHKLGLSLEDKIILTVGGLVPRKGIDRLIRATALLSGEAQAGQLNPKLYVIGEGPERKALESQISKLGLDKQVFLLGAKPQVKLVDWYAAADLFCLASHREGCPNVVLEAMACGLPVVAAEMDGIREFVDSGRGQVVANPLAENFASAIKLAMASDWDRQKIAATTERSWQTVAEEVMREFVRRGHKPFRY